MTATTATPRTVKDTAAIPEDLKALPWWVVWRYKIRDDGKPTKVPFCARKPRRNARVDVPPTWSTFEQAVAAYEATPDLAGIGLVLKKGIVGFDFDDCIDDAGRLEPWAANFVRALSSYTEVTPSGRGVRVFVRGELHHKRRRTGRFEVYSSEHFLTLTGNRLPDAPATVNDNRQDAINAVTAEAFAYEDTAGAATPTSPSPSSPVSTGTSGALMLSDGSLIERIRQSAQGAKFSALWAGRWEGSYPSQSDADAALLAMLRFWTQGDRERSLRLFGMSALGAREKWTERSDYREATWSAVAAGRVYEPPKSGMDTVGSGVDLSALTGEAARSTHEGNLAFLNLDIEREAALSPRYSTRSWRELADLTLPSKEFFFGEAFALGRLGLIVGQGGLGKSRIALNLARNQVLGLDFAGLPTGTRPLRHLFMGSENDIHRLQIDVRCMSRGLSVEDLRKLGDHIRMATLEDPEDSSLTLASSSNVARWTATLDDFAPDVLWVDPWGDVLAGEANADEDNRATLATLTTLARRANKDCAVTVLHHARTGARNVAEAVGYGGANFSKGSKAVYSSARAVWNLAPGDESENPPIVFALAKNNNGPRIPPFAVRLDAETMTYTRDESFDVAAWIEGVERKATGRGGGRSPKNAEPVEAYRERVEKLAGEKGAMPSALLHDAVRSALHVGEKKARAIVVDCVEAGIVQRSDRMKTRGGQVYIGLPDDIRRMAEDAEEGAP